MSAYLIGEIEVTDAKTYEEYRKLVPGVIAKFGGKYLVRGGAVETCEGNWSPKRLVLLEFPSMDRARAFHGSPEYAPLLAMRTKSAKSKLILVEGI